MSTRGSREGNTDAPKVDEHEVRDDRGSRHTPLEEERGTSWISVILGWLTALGAGLILSSIVSGIVGAIFGSAGRQGITEGGTTALIGLLFTLLHSLPHRWLCSREVSIPLRTQARHTGATAGSGRYAGAGGSGWPPRGELHRPALGGNAAAGRAAERPAGGSAAGAGHYPDRLGHPGVALPLHRWGHWRSVGSKNRQPQAISKAPATSRTQTIERRVGR
jgi:hypothetical protein